MTDKQNDRLISTQELANFLGVKRNTIEKARSLGLGDYPPFIKVGRCIRYRMSDVEAWLKRRSYNNDASKLK